MAAATQVGRAADVFAQVVRYEVERRGASRGAEAGADERRGEGRFLRKRRLWRRRNRRGRRKI